MNSFGLGLVLNFVDNASSGMASATRTFTQMSAVADEMTSTVSASALEMTTIAYALSEVGDIFVQTGSAITEVFAGITQQIIDAGSKMQGYRMQLSALYGSAESGQQVMDDIKQYAMSSVFDIQSLIPAVTLMKAVGIEAMQEVTTSSGNATQKLLDYASDIAAMVPNMRNSYGTGVEAAMGAIKEYIAEGNALSLKRGAGLDILGILGEEKGATMEERTQQVADLVEQLGILGYTASLAGTPTQRLSNMQDALFNTLTKIADSGVFDAYSRLLERLSDWLFQVVEDEESFNTITSILADTVTTLMSPLNDLLELLISVSDSVLEWAKNHPTLTKYILLTVAAMGVALTAGGLLLKTLSSLTLAFIGLSYIRQLIPMMSLFGSTLLGIVPKLMPIAAFAGLVYLAWKNNMFGIRDVVTKTINDIGAILSIAFDALADNTLSEEQWVRMNELGITPFIESLLLLKYYWGYFVEGFKSGFSSFIEGITDSLGKLQLMGIDINGLTAALGDFLKGLLEVGSEDKWSAVGKAFGEISAFLVTLFVVGNAIKGVFQVFSAIGGVLSAVFSIVGGIFNIFKVLFNPVTTAIVKVIGFFKDFGAAISLVKEGFSVFEVLGAWFPKISTFFTNIGSVVSTIGGSIVSFFTKLLLPAIQYVGGVIMSGLTALSAALGLPVAAVVAIIAAVVALVAAIVIFRDEIAQFFSNLWETIVNSPFGQTVIQIFETVYQAVSSFISEALEVISSFANMVWTIVQGIAQVFASVFEVVKAVVKNAVDIITSLFRLMYEVVRVIVLTVVLIFQTAFNFIYTNIVQPFVSILQTAFQWLCDYVLSPVGEFFKNVWTSAVDFVTPIIIGISDFFQQAAEKITEIFTGVKDFFVGVFDSISQKAGEFFDWISEKLSWITETINAIGSFFSGGINAAAGFVGGIGDKLQSMVGLSTGGYVKTTGIAVLHPNEVVVNDSLTKRLGLFLDDYQEKPTNSAGKSSPVVVQTDNSGEEDFQFSFNPSPRPEGGVTPRSVNSDNNGKVENNDYSVTFMAGSVVIQLANATDAELEKAADKLMKIIERKQQLKKLATRS